MSALPNFSDTALREAFLRRAPLPLSEAQATRLIAHYRELQRWSPRLALIGPGTTQDVVDRHYGEALAAIHWLPGTRPLRILDVGSGAGFPGFVLAAALDGVEVTFVEPRGRKQAFLRAACRRAALPCSVPDARVELPWPTEIPGDFDLVTSRALRLETELWRELGRRLTPAGRLLLWVGRETPDYPEDWTLARTLMLPETDHRRVLDLSPRGCP